MENSMEVPQKTKYRATIWFRNATPGHISRQKKTSIQKDTCIHMFIAAQFTIAKTWKQPKCPLTEEWIKKMWYICTMEYYSAIKMNKIPAFLATWKDLENIMLGEVSHTMRHQHQMLSLTCGIWKKDRLNFAEQMLTHRHWKTYGLRKRQFRGMFLVYGMEILWNWIVMIIIQLQIWYIHLSNKK